MTLTKRLLIGVRKKLTSSNSPVKKGGSGWVGGSDRGSVLQQSVSYAVLTSLQGKVQGHVSCLIRLIQYRWKLEDQII